MPTMITFYTVNDVGLKEIKEFLSANHKMGPDFTIETLHRWAAYAEYETTEGRPAFIELTPSESIHGCAQRYVISDDGLDSEEVDLDECISQCLDNEMGTS